MKNDERQKTHFNSLCLNQITPTFSFTLFQLTVSAISFHHYCIIYWMPAFILSIFEQNPLQLLIFKNPYLKGGSGIIQARLCKIQGTFQGLLKDFPTVFKD